MLRLATGESLQAVIPNDESAATWAQGTPVHCCLPADGIRVLAPAPASDVRLGLDAGGGVARELRLAAAGMRSRPAARGGRQRSVLRSVAASRGGCARHRPERSGPASTAIDERMPVSRSPTSSQARAIPMSSSATRTLAEERGAEHGGPD